jgi:hypothetical protein
VCCVQISLARVLGSVRRSEPIHINNTADPGDRPEVFQANWWSACAAMLRCPALCMILRTEGHSAAAVGVTALAMKARARVEPYRVHWMAACMLLAALRVDPLIGLSVVPMLSGLIRLIGDGPVARVPSQCKAVQIKAARLAQSRFARAVSRV